MVRIHLPFRRRPAVHSLLAGLLFACLAGLPACDQSRGAVLAAAPPRGDFQPTEAFEGYTLFTPLRGKGTHLIDMAGEVVHTWPSEYKANSFYLLDDGSVLRSALIEKPPTFDGGGQAGRLERISWDGEIVWEYEYVSEDHLQHHDMEPLPNGNVLFIAWERKTREEAIAAGRDPELLQWETFWPDKVVEVRPILPDGGEIVWEWHAWDHLIQEFDPSAPNYGKPSEHPERIAVNGDRKPESAQLTPEEETEEMEKLAELGYATGEDAEAEDEEDPEAETKRRRRTADWLHTNAIDYHPELDLIVLSPRRFHEIWVIDHSTTTEEARGSSGGHHGRGGDLLYRWGNPAAYGMGAYTERPLFGQHDVQWIPNGYLGAGNFLLFNNGNEKDGRAWSSIEEFRMPMNAGGRIQRVNGRPFGPVEPVWRYESEPREDFFSSFISGTQRLPNGNTLVCSGEHGLVFEVTPSGEEVWRWENPLGDEPDPDDPDARHGEPRTSLFRATRIAPEHPGLALLEVSSSNQEMRPSGLTSD